MATTDVKRGRDTGGRGQGGGPHRRAPLLHDGGIAAVRRGRVGGRATRSSPARTAPRSSRSDVEFPAFWSQTATNIVAQKYFRGKLDSPEREHSVRQMIGRVADTVTGLGHQGLLLRRQRRGRDVPRRADPSPAAPDGRVQLAGVVQRRVRGAPAVLRLLHPLGRGQHGVDPRLDPQGGPGLPRRLRVGHQPVASCAPRRSSWPRAATPPGPCRSCAAPTRRRARSSRAARRAGRPRWSS